MPPAIATDSRTLKSTVTETLALAAPEITAGESMPMSEPAVFRERTELHGIGHAVLDDVSTGGSTTSSTVS